MNLLNKYGACNICGLAGSGGGELHTTICVMVRKQKNQIAQLSKQVSELEQLRDHLGEVRRELEAERPDTMADGEHRVCVACGLCREPCKRCQCQLAEARLSPELLQALANWTATRHHGAALEHARRCDELEEAINEERNLAEEKKT